MNVFFYFFLLFLFFLINLFYFPLLKEGFTWSDSSKDEFVRLQHTINPNIIFDTEEIQKQASQKDLNYYLSNGIWYWSDKVKNMYKKASEHNPYIRTSPEDSMNYAQKIYNENAILQVLKLNNEYNIPKYGGL
jgi:hypothetical protein